MESFDEHERIQPQNHNHSQQSINAENSISDNNKKIIPSSAKNTKEELLVIGYFRALQKVIGVHDHAKIPPNVIYQTNVFHGSSESKHKYKFGDITKGTLQMAAQGSKAATKAIKNYKFGDITKGIIRKINKKNKKGK